MRIAAPVAAVAVLSLFATPASSQSFTRITSGPMVTDTGAGRSVNWVDFDGDGYLDLFVSNGLEGGQENYLYRNAHDGTFTQVTTGPLVTGHEPSDGASWADVDNDGDLDAFVTAWYDSSNAFYRNNGDGTFTQVFDSPLATDHGYSETCSWGDYDNDGWLDLYVSNSGAPSLGGPKINFLYHNEHDGSFTRVAAGQMTTDATYSRGVSWVDYDNDGDLDMFVANERGGNESLYKNMLTETGTATFTKVTTGLLVTAGGNSFSASWADADNDGDLDVFVTNGWPSASNNAFFLNNGGVFTRVLSDTVVKTPGFNESATWGDIDNDGDLDLFVTTAYGPASSKNLLYRNMLMETGTLSFQRVGTGDIVNDLGMSFGCAFGDYDLDGDLDLFVAKTFNENESDALYRNDNANGNHWLEVRCMGTVSNRSGIGARLHVLATIGGRPVWQMREVDGQSGYCGQNLDQHFGLGDATVIDSVRIEWPGGGRDVYANVAADRLVIAKEGVRFTAVDGALPGAAAVVSMGQNMPNPFAPRTRIPFTLVRDAHVTMTVVDVQGRLVRTLVDARMNAGRHEVEFDAAGVANGVYFYSVVARAAPGHPDAVVARRKLVVTR